MLPLTSTSWVIVIPFDVSVFTIGINKESANLDKIVRININTKK